MFVYILGFGDISPMNDLERIYCIIIMLIGTAIFAYTINTVGIILQEMNKVEKERNTKLINLN